MSDNQCPGSDTLDNGERAKKCGKPLSATLPLPCRCAASSRVFASTLTRLSVSVFRAGQNVGKWLCGIPNAHRHPGDAGDTTAAGRDRDHAVRHVAAGRHGRCVSLLVLCRLIRALVLRMIPTVPRGTFQPGAESDTMGGVDLAEVGRRLAALPDPPELYVVATGTTINLAQ